MIDKKIKTIVAVAMLSLLASQAQVVGQGLGFGALDPYFSFSLGDSSPPGDIPNVTGQVTSPDGYTVSLSGAFGPIDGARFGNNFVLYWSGSFVGPISAGDTFTADLDFQAQATGGALSWRFSSEMFSTLGFEYARIDTTSEPLPVSGEVSGIALQSSAFTTDGSGGNFQGYLLIDWTGFTDTDTLTVTVPSHSIDITYVPEPTSAALILLGGFLLATWRHRRGR